MKAVLRGAGVDTRAFDSDANTPLDVAILSSKVACVKLLIEKQAGRPVLDVKARTLANQIADIGVRTQINLLLVQSSQKQASGTMPWNLQYVASHGQIDVGQMLLNMGANPNGSGRRWNRSTPARPALDSDNAMVALLLSKGAQVDARSTDGSLPIHDAALGKSPDVVRLLASHGADIAAVAC